MVTLNYNEIGRIKEEQNRLIAEGKIEKPSMQTGFTLEERRMFNNGIPMDILFENVTEQYRMAV